MEMLTTPIPNPPENPEGASTILLATPKVERKKIVRLGTCFEAVIIGIALLILSPAIFGFAKENFFDKVASTKSNYATNQDRIDVYATLKHFYDALEGGRFAEAMTYLDKNAFSDYDADTLERSWESLMASVGHVRREFDVDFKKADIDNAVHAVVTIEPLSGIRRNKLDVVVGRIDGDWKIVDASPMLIPW